MTCAKLEPDLENRIQIYKNQEELANIFIEKKAHKDMEHKIKTLELILNR